MNDLLDDSSSIYSLYSRPMTRTNSSAEESDILPTPLDDGTDNNSLFRDNVPGPRRMNGSRTPSYRSTFENPKVRGEPRLSAVLETQEDYSHTEPHTIHLGALDSNCDNGGSLLQSRSSAKELIRRYESMRADSRQSSRSGYSDISSSVKRNMSGDEKALPGLPPPVERKKDKSHSPLRKSFRNLISVFKKSRRASKDKVEIGNSLLLQYRKDPQMYSSRVSTNTFVDEPAISCDITPRPVSSSPARLLTASLLYLSRLSPPSHSPSQLLPVWTHCTATLFPTHILLTSKSAQNNPHTHTVPLISCADVRSIAFSDLTDNERAMLPETGASGRAGEPKVFEIVFEGRPKEKFAASSVKERAAWVSAVWDAILHAQEQKNKETPRLFSSVVTGPLRPEALRSSDRHSHDPLLTQNEIKDRLGSQQVADPHPSYSADRSLPPTPALSSPSDSTRSLPTADHQASGPHALLGFHPPQSRASMLSRPPSTSPRPQSPSIRNLDQKSVVRKRLAQFQESGSISRPSSGSIKLNQVRRADENAVPRLAVQIQPRSMPLPPSRKEHTNMDVHGPSSPVSVYTQHKTPDTPNSSDSLRLTASPAELTRDDDDGRRGLPPTSSRRFQRSEQSPDIAYQVALLQQNLKNLSANIEAATANANPSQDLPEMKYLLEDLGQKIQSIGVLNGDGAQELTVMRRTLEETRQEIGRHFDESMRHNLDQSATNTSAILEKVDQVHNELHMGMPEVLDILKRLRYGDIFSCNEENPGAALHDQQSSKTEGQVSTMDFGPLHDKLDKLLGTMHQNSTLITAADGKDEKIKPSMMEGMDELKEITRLVRENNTQHTVHLDQQADSVRYLNELNSWLEAFVNHGVSQIQLAVDGVQDLRKELGSVSATPTRTGDVARDIERLLRESGERGQDNAKLLASVDKLVAVVNEDLQRATQARQGPASESVMALIDRQRQDQERMLRDLADELSKDIRGERLRFVEAMKEATAINVQSHVEQFKKQLSREVLLMTQDIARMQRERQTLEQQVGNRGHRQVGCYQQGPIVHSTSSQAHLIQTLPSQSSSRWSEGGPRPKPVHDYYIRQKYGHGVR